MHRPLPQVRAVLEAAAAAVGRFQAPVPAAALLLRGRGGAPEPVGPAGLPADVGEGLEGGAASLLALLPSGAGGPMVLRAEAFPPGAAALGAALASRGMGAVALVPLAGEVEPVGCLVVPLTADTLLSDPGALALAHAAPVALQVAAGSALLGVLLSEEHAVDRMLAVGAVVVDGGGRVVLVGGSVRDVAEWRRPDPFGVPLEDLPPLAVGSVVELTGPGRAGGGRVVLVHGAIHAAGYPAAELPWPLRVAARVSNAAAGVQRAASGCERGPNAPGRSGPGRGLALLGELAEGADAARTLAREVAERFGSGPARPPVDLAQVADALVRDHADALRRGRVRLFSFIAPTPCPPGTDVLAVGEALDALVVRARRALAPTGGTLTVRTWSEDGWACAAVSHDGGGGGEEDGALATVGATVEALGGRFHAEVRPGVWSRCTLLLPLQPQGRPAARPTETIARRNAAGCLSVLVVDDNAALRSVLRRYLERRGHRVTEAEDGEAALRAVARDDAFDRLIVDVQMPGRSGPEVFRGLEGLAPHLQGRTLFMTGDRTEPVLDRFLAESGRPAVAKPFDLAELARLLEGAA